MVAATASACPVPHTVQSSRGDSMGGVMGLEHAADSAHEWMNCPQVRI